MGACLRLFPILALLLRSHSVTLFRNAQILQITDGPLPVPHSHRDLRSDDFRQQQATAIHRDVRVGQGTALMELQWISANLLTAVLSSDAYRQGMGELIFSRLAEGMPLFQSALVSLVHADERLGDPRLAYCAPNRRTVLPEAREKFLAWLAKDTLQFFFDTLVPRNDRNRRRAEFGLSMRKNRARSRTSKWLCLKMIVLGFVPAEPKRFLPIPLSPAGKQVRSSWCLKVMAGTTS